MTEFDDEVSIKSGGDNDLIAAFDTIFNNDLDLNGGGGFDEVFDAGNNTFDSAPNDRNIEDEFDGTITDVVNLFNSKPTFVASVALLNGEGS